MPTADNKKVATIENLWYLRVAKPILDANAVVAEIRAAIASEGLVGEFPQAKRDAMLAVETDVGNLAASSGVSGAEARYHPTHRGRALIIEGVNDG